MCLCVHAIAALAEYETLCMFDRQGAVVFWFCHINWHSWVGLSILAEMVDYQGNSCSRQAVGDGMLQELLRITGML